MEAQAGRTAARVDSPRWVRRPLASRLAQRCIWPKNKIKSVMRAFQSDTLEGARMHTQAGTALQACARTYTHVDMDPEVRIYDAYERASREGASICAQRI